MTITNKKPASIPKSPPRILKAAVIAAKLQAPSLYLWLTQHLLESYGKDAEITKLIDTKTIYVPPENNPDGATMYYFSAQRNRSTVHPNDNDRDGLLDEDGEDDLDADGVMYQMRKKVQPQRNR